jgi:hypothetical protein
VLFALELDRRVRDCSTAGLRSLAVHPGLARSELVAKASIGSRPVVGSAARASVLLGAQPTAHGALPSLYAATNPEAAGGEFIGPRLEMRGAVVRVKPSRAARDPKLARDLWNASVEATGVGYEELRASTA